MIEALLLLCALIAMVFLLLAEIRSLKNDGDKNIGIFNYRDLVVKVSAAIDSKLSKRNA